MWNKAALVEDLDPQDRPTGLPLIVEMLDGLPSSFARMCRTEFSPNPTVSDLSRELQVMVPRWHRDNNLYERDRPCPATPFLPCGAPSADLPVRGAPPSDPSPVSVDRPHLSFSYDPSIIGSQPHPVTKKLTRYYTKPNGTTIYLNRNCSHCHESRFDFKHDSLFASSEFRFEESGYDEWECDSDTVAGDAVKTQGVL